MSRVVEHLAYLVAAVLFIFSLHWMNTPKTARRGVLAGVADFLAFPIGGRKLAIELKDNKGVQDADQIKFQRRWERAGGAYFVVRTLTDFQVTVDCAVMFG